MGGWIANAGSCNTGLISAPFKGAMGNMVINGLEVINKNNKKPTNIIDITPILFGLSISSFFMLILKKYPHKDKKTIHKNIDPSWALQMEEIL